MEAEQVVEDQQQDEDELISLRQLLECGVHFGHPARKWDPKMEPYIFDERNGIHILDLELTQQMIKVVHDFLFVQVSEGKKVLFVGTKQQATDAIREEAKKCGMPFVNQRWLGGMLTNWETIEDRVKRLRDLRDMKADGYFDRLTKKDRRRLQDELDRLNKFLGGISEMRDLPGAIFVVDVEEEKNAVLEANRLGIPVIGIIDSNCDPDLVQYKLPGNDDAIRSIRLFCSIVSDSILEAKNGYLPEDSVFLQKRVEEDEEESGAEGFSEEDLEAVSESDAESADPVGEEPDEEPVQAKPTGEED